MPLINSGPTLAFDLRDGQLYVKPSKRPTLSDGSLSRRIPFPLSCTIARLLHGMFIPNVVTRGKPESTPEQPFRMTINAPMGKRLVAVRLGPGEVVAFNLAYLVAFTSNIKLWTEIVFSIPAFGTDRNFIQNAEGPGMIVFEVNGQETTESAPNFRFNPSRLVAWTPEIQFTFCGIDSFWDVYLNEIMLCAVSIPCDSLLLLDADSEASGGAKGAAHNLFKCLKRVYIPI